jgi:hypothetical protein
MADKITIPQKHIDFCKAVAKLAAEAGYYRLGMTLSPGYNDEWSDQLQMNWDSGRHGSYAHKVIVSSTVTVRAEAV